MSFNSWVLSAIRSFAHQLLNPSESIRMLPERAGAMQRILPNGKGSEQDCIVMVMFCMIMNYLAAFL